MKRYILIIALLLLSVSAFAQAKKPTIMILPSDAYCSRNGYTTEWIDENGNIVIDFTRTDGKLSINQKVKEKMWDF